MKSIYVVMREVENERKNPGQYKPLSPETLHAIAIIIEQDKALDKTERRAWVNHGI